MRSLILLFCFMFGFVALSNQESFGDFSYDIDRFTVVSGSSSFVDEFDDGEEPPSGPSGPSTYFSTPFSADAESGGMLNLNSNDAIIGDDPSMDIVVSLTDNTYFFNSGSGGRLEGKFRFINGFGTNTGFIITIHDTPLSELESSSLYIQKEISGRIVAYFDFWIPGTGGCTIISQIDVTDLLGTSTDITLRLDINTANVVTASLDIGSKGTLDLTMPGSYTLTFPGETKHTGAFLAFEDFARGPSEILIDIKPQSCPNPLNVKSKGVLPVGILGMADFDVRTIDVASINLNGVAPVKSAFEDISAPAFKTDTCDCEALSPDSFEDLVLKFDTQEIVTSLGTVQDGEEIILTLNANLLENEGGTAIEGTDCVLIKAKGK